MKKWGGSILDACNRYAIVPKEKRKFLEEIMRSDKRINPCK